MNQCGKKGKIDESNLCDRRFIKANVIIVHKNRLSILSVSHLCHDILRSLLKSIRIIALQEEQVYFFAQRR